MFPLPAQLGSRFTPGTMLGRYELLATIGVGGMANVILARQRGPAGFEKIVVIKVVHPHMAENQVAVTMLLDEARVAAQLDHQNIVHTYELGEADGTFYIVMEYLAGESLGLVLKQSTLQNRAMSPFVAAKIVAEAAEGLHYAHELRDFTGAPIGIVHRDVSPGNIVVEYNGAVKVVDFGIAKAHGRVTSTQQGELKGKFGYMSPEQINNDAMDRRSDVFSLGVVLWESLTRRRLFQADNVAATLMQILNGGRTPPSVFDPEIPHSLDLVAVRALAANPDERFQTVDEMKQAIDDAIWKARIGATEISEHMSALFRDSIETRRTLLSRAARDSLSVVDFEVLGTAFRDPGSISERVSVPRSYANTPSPYMPALQAPSPGTEWIVPAPQAAPPGPAWGVPSPQEVTPGPVWSASAPQDAAPGTAWGARPPQDVTPGPAWVAPAPQDAAPGPAWIAPAPQDAAPGPAWIAPAPQDAVPGPAWIAPAPQDAAPGPTSSASTPYDVLPGSVWNWPAPAPLRPPPAPPPQASSHPSWPERGNHYTGYPLSSIPAGATGSWRTRRIALMLSAGAFIGIALGIFVGFRGRGGGAQPAAISEPPPVEDARLSSETTDAKPAPPVVPATREPTVRTVNVVTPPTVPASPPEAPAAAGARPEPTPETPVTVGARPEPTPETPVTVGAPAEPTPVTRPPRSKPNDTGSKPSKGSLEEHYKRGTEAYLAGNFSVAETEFKQALAIDRSYGPAHRGLGFLYQRTGDTSQAVTSLRVYLRVTPNARDGAAIRKRIQQLGGE